MPDRNYITKGSIVSVSRLKAKPLGTYSIGGQQEKFVADLEEFTGTVMHVYGDHPSAPTKTWLIVMLEDGTEVEVNPDTVTKVFARD